MTDRQRPQHPDVYFANLEGDDLAAELRGRFDDHIARLKYTGRHDRMRRSYRMYYGKDGTATNSADNSRLQEGGRQGELTMIKPNRYRARLQRLLNMNAGSNPSFQPIALNTDSETTRECMLAAHIIEYYGSAKKLWERLLERDEHALVMGETFVFSVWDWNRGEVYTYEDVPKLNADGSPVMEDAPTEPEMADTATPSDVEPVAQADTGAPEEPDDATDLDDMGQAEGEAPSAPQEPPQQPAVDKVARRTGDFRVGILTPYDCATEPYSEDRDMPNWCIFRFLVNKFDLAVQYPGLRDKILALKPWSTTRADIDFLSNLEPQQVDEAVAIYMFFHQRTMSVPDGKQAYFIEGDTLLSPAIALEYKQLPIFRTAPGDIILTDGGYTPGFDLLPVCQLQQATLSVVASNQAAHGVQLVVADKQAGLDIAQVGPLTVLYKNQGTEVKGDNFTDTPKEIFTFYDVLIAEENNIAGTNQSSNGEGQSGSSGSKEALLVSAAQQMQTRFQKSRQLADSLLLTHMIDTMKSHATVERMIEIGGKSSSYASKTFLGSNLKGVSRIMVEPANPSRDTPEGRAARAQRLIEMGLIKTISDYDMVISTGRLEHEDDTITAQETPIKQENELLSDPKNDAVANPDTFMPVIVAPTDRHSLHILKHARVLDSPDARSNPETVKRVWQHMNEHANALRTLDPQILNIIGETSLMPPPPPPPPPGAPGGNGQALGPDNAKAQGGNQPDMPAAPKDLTTGQPAQMPGGMPQMTPG